MLVSGRVPDFLGKLDSKFDFEPMFSLGLEPGRAGLGPPRVLRREALPPWSGRLRKTKGWTPRKKYIRCFPPTSESLFVF